MNFISVLKVVKGELITQKRWGILILFVVAVVTIISGF